MNTENRDDTTTALLNNAIIFSLDEIGYKLFGTEIDRVQNVGITTTIKKIFTWRPSNINCMGNAG